MDNSYSAHENSAQETSNNSTGELYLSSEGSRKFTSQEEHLSDQDPIIDQGSY